MRRHADLIAHWQARDLPLVVCSQPPGLGAERLAVGLPAPQRWSRRRLALQVAQAQVLRQGEFPPLAAVLHDEASQALAPRTGGPGSQRPGLWLPRLAGPHGRGVRARGLGIDLLIQVSGFAAAARPCPAATGRLPGRLDGEFVFPQGQAIAWREFAHLLHAEQPAGAGAGEEPGRTRLMPAAWVRQLGLAAAA